MDGRLVTGRQMAGNFVAATADTLAETIGFRPYHGTLNLQDVDGIERLPLRTIDEDLGDPHCDGVHFRPCTIGGIRGSVIRPLVPDYPEGQVELLAPIRLRRLFGFDDGAVVPIAPPDDHWTPTGPSAVPSAMDAFDGVVFDLDGTLVDLAVDWATVHDEIEDRIGPYLDRPVREYGHNDLFAVARERDEYDDLVEMIASYEEAGAHEAAALPGIHSLDKLACPVAICTANATAAAEVALDRFDVRSAVDAIVARETTEMGKPHPTPVLAALDQLGVSPGNALMVGDQPTDAEAAARADTSFLHVDQLWPMP